MQARQPLSELRVGQQFAVSGIDPEDQEIVTVRKLTESHVLLESMGEMQGWKPRELVLGAIAEATAPRFPRTPQ